MPFCAKCGSPVEGRFCAKCGSAVPSPVQSAPPPVGAVPPAPAPPPVGAVPPGYMPPPPAASAPMADNLSSALCYVPLVGWIISIIFLVIAPYNQNRTVRFHAFQSIFLAVAALAIRIVLGFVFSIMHLYEFFFLWSLFSLAFFALWLFMIIATYQGKTIVLPVIGPIAQQQA